MSGDGKPKKKLRRMLGIAFSLLFAAAFAYIAISVISGRDMGIKRLLAVFSRREPVAEADELTFEVGHSRVFADMGEAVAAVGTLGVQLLDKGGGELMRDSFRLFTPSIAASNGRAIAFDTGGTDVRAFDTLESIASFKTESDIISASINENGWFCVCIGKSGGYISIVTVYNNLGKEVYKVSISTGYALSAHLSQDNGKLAVLTLIEGGSRITCYDLGKEEPDSMFNLPNKLIIEIKYMPNGAILAVTTDALIAVDRNGEGSELYWFAGKRLGGYTLGTGFIALHLLDYGVGNSGRLVTLDGNGAFLGMIVTDYEVKSMSAGAQHLLILKNDEISAFDMELCEVRYTAPSADVQGYERIMALGSSAALLTNEHSAEVIRAIGSNN